MSKLTDDELRAIRDHVRTSNAPFFVQARSEIDGVLSGVPLPDPIPNMRLKDIRELMYIAWVRGHSAAREPVNGKQN